MESYGAPTIEDLAEYVEGSGNLRQGSAVGILVRNIFPPFLLVAASLGPIDQAAAMGGRDNWRSAFSSRKKSRE